MSTPRQIEAHALAQFFFWRSKAKGIVVATSRPDLLAFQYPPEVPIYVIVSPWSSRNFKAVHPNIHPVNILSVNEEFIFNKIFVFLNYSNGLSSSTLLLTKSRVNQLFKDAQISIISSEKNKELKLSSADTLESAGQVLHGYSSLYVGDKEKNHTLLIGGRDITFTPSSSKFKVLAIIHAYNEEDIIASTIEHLHEQGISVHVIDNWSTDNTFQTVASLSKKMGDLTFERFPDKPTKSFELSMLLDRVRDIALEKKQFDWITINDADEFRFSPWRGISLRDAIAFVDKMGYNAIDYTVFNFIPTIEGFNEANQPLEFFKYGEFGTASGNFVQIKTWKNSFHPEIAASGGHHVDFEGQHIYPIKFLLNHFPIRSTKHGQNKIINERQKRYSKSEKLKGWHVHYSEVNKKTSFLKKKKELIKVDRVSFYQDYLVERISGIGIKQTDS